METALLGPKVELGRTSGNQQDKANSVNQHDEISDMAPACLFCGSVGVGVGGRLGAFRKGTVASDSILSGRKLLPSSCHDARHFILSLCAFGAFQSAAPVLELRGSESMLVCAQAL